MEDSSPVKKIKEIFIKIFPEENDLSFKMDKKQSEFKNWDSFAHLQLVSEIEKQFNVRFDIDEVMNFNSPNDFLKFVNHQ